MKLNKRVAGPQIIPRWLFDKIVGLGLAGMGFNAAKKRLYEKYPAIKVPDKSIHAGIGIANKIKTRWRSRTNIKRRARKQTKS